MSRQLQWPMQNLIVTSYFEYLLQGGVTVLLQNLSHNFDILTLFRMVDFYKKNTNMIGPWVLECSSISVVGGSLFSPKPWRPTLHERITELWATKLMGIFSHQTNVYLLTHWGLVMCMSVSEWHHYWFRWCLIACSAQSHDRDQSWRTVIWNHYGTIVSKIWIEIQQFSFKEMHLKMSSAACWP